MTLQDCFDLLAANPAIIIFFFCAVPLTAILACELDRGDSHLSPWKYLYAVLVYLVTIPGLFAVVLNIYLIIFEGRSIMDIDIYTQILPIVSMLITLYIIKKNVNLDEIPGFDKLSGLMMIIFAFMAIFWILDKTRIVAFTHFPFYYILLLFVALVMLAAYGLKRMKT